MSQIIQFLEMMQQSRRLFLEQNRPIKPREGYRFQSIDELLLKHGRSFKPKAKPKGVHWGRAKECYCNAATLATGSGLGLTYCEGYAAGIIPVLHAWCVNDQGEVVDNTWRTKGTEYFGVPFKTSYLIGALILRGYYGLLDNWEQGWPLLKEAPEKWIKA